MTMFLLMLAGSATAQEETRELTKAERKALQARIDSLQHADSLAMQPARDGGAPADSLHATADSIAAAMPPHDTIQAPVPDSTAMAVALDTTAIGQQSDSLLRNLPLTEKRFIPDPQRALWLSLVIPGAGQIYNRKLWKIPIVYGGFLGCLYALTWNNQMLSDYSQAYLDIMDDDPNTKSYENMLPLNYSIEGREDQYKEIFKNKKNFYRRYRDLSIFCMIAVYLLSIVDAYVDAELSSFDISKDLGLQVEPAIFNFGRRRGEAAVGIQCNLNF